MRTTALIKLPSDEILQPPPPPRKSVIRREIEVSASVRRRLDFDFCENSEVDVKPKRMRMDNGYNRQQPRIQNQRKSESYFRPTFEPKSFANSQRSTAETIFTNLNPIATETFNTTTPEDISTLRYIELSEISTIRRNIYNTPTKNKDEYTEVEQLNSSFSSDSSCPDH